MSSGASGNYSMRPIPGYTSTAATSSAAKAQKAPAMTLAEEILGLKAGATQQQTSSPVQQGRRLNTLTPQQSTQLKNVAEHFDNPANFKKLSKSEKDLIGKIQLHVANVKSSKTSSLRMNGAELKLLQNIDKKNNISKAATGRLSMSKNEGSPPLAQQVDVLFNESFHGKPEELKLVAHEQAPHNHMDDIKMADQLRARGVNIDPPGLEQVAAQKKPVGNKNTLEEAGLGFLNKFEAPTKDADAVVAVKNPKSRAKVEKEFAKAVNKQKVDLGGLSKEERALLLDVSDKYLRPNVKAIVLNTEVNTFYEQLLAKYPRK